MKFSPLSLIGSILSCLAVPLSAAITPAELRAVLGDHEGIMWSVDNPQYWSVGDDRLILISPTRDAIHYLEAVVSGPGVLEMRPASPLWPEGRILVNGEQSGGRLSPNGNNRIQVAEGTHTIRLQLKNTALAHSQPVFVELYPVQWGSYTELPLQEAGVSAGAVTLSGDWIGQDRVHRGIGSAAWSGIHVLGLPDEPVVRPVMRAEFSGAGVFSYYSLANGSFLGNWNRVIQRMEEGDHVIEWKPASGNSSHRQDRDLVIDEIRFTPEVPLAVALDTPEWIWEGIDGGEGRPFGAETPESRGGARVILPNRSGISTQLPGEGLLRIRYTGNLRTVTLEGEKVSLYALKSDPDGAESDLKGGLIVVPPGGGLLEISTLWKSEVDAVEWVPPPSSITATLDIPDIITIGGTGTWTSVPSGPFDQYVVEWTPSESPGEGWLEFPVTGPAQVTVLGHPFPDLLVDGRLVWRGGMAQGGVTIEIPNGTHLFRCAGRTDLSSSLRPRIRAIAIKPLATEKFGTAMKSLLPWASRGAWKSSANLTYDGVSALQPDPPPSIHQPPFSPSTSTHVLQAPVRGPGFVSFMTYVQRSPEVGHVTSIQFGSDLHTNLFRRVNEDPQGWLTHTIWYPPGDHWIRWSVTGTEHELSRVGLGGFAFEASEMLAFDEIVGSEVGVWQNDPDRPWTGIRKEPGEEPFIISPMHGPAEPTRISLAVEGPGELTFHWRMGAKRQTEGELWINGRSSRKLPSYQDGEEVTVLVPEFGPITFEWLFTARGEGNWVTMKDFTWTPLPQVSLAEALDAPPEVTWTTSPERPFRGVSDPDARNGSSAQVGLLPGEETWLEATVEGSGLFDFWFRGVPGAFNDPRDLEWELFINGVKSHIFPRATSWPAQWVLGDGPHAIRLVFRNNSQDTRRAFIAVDDVSWVPLTGTAGGEGWAASHPGMVEGFADGGFEDGPQHVIPVATGETRWIEKTVEGPGILHWKARLIRGATPGIQRRVLVNGVGHLPLDRDTAWTTHRLHLPQGEHTVRWFVEPNYPAGLPYPTQSDSIWQISAATFTPGFSSLMQGLDDDAMVWLEVGEEAGSLLGAESAYDGEDAWALGDQNLIYLCNTSEQGIKAEGMVHTSLDPESPFPWRRIFRWAPPGESVEWARAPEAWSLTTSSSPVRRVDRFEMRTVDLIPLQAAMDTDEEIGGRGWIGLADAVEAFDGTDAAWSYLGPSYSSNVASLELETAASVCFRWRASGTGNFALRVNGAWLPVPPAQADWREVELELQGPSLVEWVHARGPETGMDARAEAWLDTLVVESRPERTISEVAGGESGLAFESVPGEAEGDVWRPIGFRDSAGVWQESVRGLPGEAMLQTTVTGPALVAFRTQFVPFDLPTSTAPASGSDYLGAHSVIIISPGVVASERFLSAFVNGVERLRIPADGGEGWQEHLFRVPAGEHQVAWQLGVSREYGQWENHVPAKQAWIRDVHLLSPKAHYESWADAFLGGIAARGPADDASDNGVINFLAYAYGLDPLDDSARPPAFFGLVRSVHPSLAGGGPLERLYLHIPRLPPLVTAVLQSSTDLLHWEPDPLPVRNFPKYVGFPRMIDRSDHDAGDHQVRVFVLHQEDPPTFYRILYDLPDDGD